MGGTYDTINRIFDTFAVTSRSRYVYVYDMSRNIARWSKNAVEYFGLAGEYIYNAVSGKPESMGMTKINTTSI